LPPAASLREDAWDQGRLAHLLPTVSHDRFLIKASFDRSALLRLSLSRSGKLDCPMNSRGSSRFNFLALRGKLPTIGLLRSGTAAIQSQWTAAFVGLMIPRQGRWRCSDTGKTGPRLCLQLSGSCEGRTDKNRRNDVGCLPDAYPSRITKWLSFKKCRILLARHGR
jgi:hypothetical protein